MICTHGRINTLRHHKASLGLGVGEPCLGLRCGDGACCCSSARGYESVGVGIRLCNLVLHTHGKVPGRLGLAMMERKGSHVIRKGHITIRAVLYVALKSDCEVEVLRFVGFGGTHNRLGYAELTSLARVGKGRFVLRALGLPNHTLNTGVALQEAGIARLFDRICQIRGQSSCRKRCASSNLYDCRTARKRNLAVCASYCSTQPNGELKLCAIVCLRVREERLAYLKITLGARVNDLNLRAFGCNGARSIAFAGDLIVILALCQLLGHGVGNARGQVGRLNLLAVGELEFSNTVPKGHVTVGLGVRGVDGGVGQGNLHLVLGIQVLVGRKVGHDGLLHLETARLARVGKLCLGVLRGRDLASRAGFLGSKTAIGCLGNRVLHTRGKAINDLRLSVFERERCLTRIVERNATILTTHDGIKRDFKVECCLRIVCCVGSNRLLHLELSGLARVGNGNGLGLFIGDGVGRLALAAGGKVIIRLFGDGVLHTLCKASGLCVFTVLQGERSHTIGEGHVAIGAVNRLVVQLNGKAKVLRFVTLNIRRHQLAHGEATLGLGVGEYHFLRLFGYLLVCNVAGIRGYIRVIMLFFHSIGNAQRQLFGRYRLAIAKRKGCNAIRELHVAVGLIARGVDTVVGQRNGKVEVLLLVGRRGADHALRYTKPARFARVGKGHFLGGIRNYRIAGLALDGSGEARVGFLFNRIGKISGHPGCGLCLSTLEREPCLTVDKVHLSVGLGNALVAELYQKAEGDVPIALRVGGHDLRHLESARLARVGKLCLGVLRGRDLASRPGLFSGKAIVGRLGNRVLHTRGQSLGVLSLAVCKRELGLAVYKLHLVECAADGGIKSHRKRERLGLIAVYVGSDRLCNLKVAALPGVLNGYALSNAFVDLGLRVSNVCSNKVIVGLLGDGISRAIGKTLGLYGGILRRELKRCDTIGKGHIAVLTIDAGIVERNGNLELLLVVGGKSILHALLYGKGAFGLGVGKLGFGLRCGNGSRITLLVGQKSRGGFLFDGVPHAHRQALGLLGFSVLECKGCHALVIKGHVAVLTADSGVKLDLEVKVPGVVGRGGAAHRLAHLKVTRLPSVGDLHGRRLLGDLRRFGNLALHVEARDVLLGNGVGDARGQAADVSRLVDPQLNGRLTRRERHVAKNARNRLVAKTHGEGICGVLGRVGRQVGHDGFLDVEAARLARVGELLLSYCGIGNAACAIARLVIAICNAYSKGPAVGFPHPVANTSG